MHSENLLYIMDFWLQQTPHPVNYFTIYIKVFTVLKTTPGNFCGTGPAKVPYVTWTFLLPY